MVLKGKLYFESFGMAHKVSKDMKYDSEYVSEYLLVDVKDNLKIVSFMSGLIRSDKNPLSFM